MYMSATPQLRTLRVFTTTPYGYERFLWESVSLPIDPSPPTRPRPPKGISTWLSAPSSAPSMTTNSSPLYICPLDGLLSAAAWIGSMP